MDSELTAIAAVLGTCEILGGLDAAARARLAGLARRVAVKRDDVLFFQGDPADGLYLVRSGEVRIVHHAADGRELVLNRLTPGCVFGEIALLDGAPRSATAIAGVDSQLLRIGRAAFVELLARHPELSREVIRLLCRRVRDTSARIEEGAFHGAPARVARYLLRLLALEPAASAPGAVRLGLHLPQATLGASVGLSRQTVNAVLGDLERAGAIRVARARIAVVDRGVLARMAEGLPPTADCAPAPAR